MSPATGRRTPFAALSGTTCPACGLKYFADARGDCPRCARSAPAGAQTSALAAAPSPYLGVPAEVVDEARARILVWNDEPEKVVRRLGGHGVPPDVAMPLVVILQKEVHAKLAPAARSTGSVYIGLGVFLALLGAGLLYAYFSGRGSGMIWGPNRFTSLLLGGGIMSVATGVVLVVRGLVRLISGKQPDP